MTGQSESEPGLTELPTVLPVFPLDGAVLLPTGILPLNIFEPRYLNMVDDIMSGPRLLGMVQTRPGGDRSKPSLEKIGCVGQVSGFAETGDGRYLISLAGLCRFRILDELPLQTPYRQARVSYADFACDLLMDDEVSDPTREALLSALGLYTQTAGYEVDWESARAAPTGSLVVSLCMALPFDASVKQELLESADQSERAELLTGLLLEGVAEAGTGSEDRFRS